MSSTPEPTPEPTGRDRLVAALRRPASRAQVIAAVLLFALGFAMSVQLHAENQDDNFAGARQSDLVALIDSLGLATDRTQTEVTQLRHTRDLLRGDTASRQTALVVARSRATTLGILAGTVPAEGPGVRVTVEAKSGDLGTDQLLNGLEELRDAGAEAIEINDTVRVVAQTGITDSPDGLVVGGQKVRAPYVIDAIGDPHTLATALEFDGGFKQDVEQVGGTVDIKESRSVEVGSTVEVPSPRFASPDQQE